MQSILVLTLIGPDRPGLVEAVARVIADGEGNWLESRMARLAGKFAGILLVSVPLGRVGELRAALCQLETMGLKLVVEESEDKSDPRGWRAFSLDLVGTDHPGIVRDVSRVLAGRDINVEDLVTGRMPAPMSGEILFTARARIRVPASLDLENLRETLEALASDLMVDIALDEGDVTDRP